MHLHSIIAFFPVANSFQLSDGSNLLAISTCREGRDWKEEVQRGVEVRVLDCQDMQCGMESEAKLPHLSYLKSAAT